ncbi:MAG: fused MFS/spermidine synthase [Deltaproteobacteria bacterium]|nr:fused MFS/spermidine synthase [Deltaproteobacteria bacterium]
MKRTGAGADKYLVFTTFISGSIVMVIELIGSRVIGPPFGVSLFVWTSLITVTLVSLALGYWIGGRIADRKDSYAALFSIILIAGLFLLAVPLTKGFIIERALSLGLRAGSLLSSTVLFGPPLFFLGMVTPYTVKLYMGNERGGVGKTVGWLYAISTAGSFIGTVSTGFLLIPNLGVNNIIYLSSLALISLSAGYWILFHKKPYLVILAIVPVVLLLAPKELPSITRPDGTKVALLVNEDSPYGQIKVVDYNFGDTRLREFLLENMIQGGIDVNSGLSISKYTYYIERLAHAYKSDASRALVIGLGSGIVPGRFDKYYNIKTDVVEINPGVIEAASKYFSYDANLHPTFAEDGRYFLKSSDSLYDVIVLDAFSGDTPPSHLISLEAFEFIGKRLAGDGVLLINFVGTNQREDAVVPESLYRTLKEVFPYVDVFTSSEYDNSSPKVVNLIFAATKKEPVISEQQEDAPVYQVFKDDIDNLLNRKVNLAKGTFLFTDDFNPIDFLDLKAREKFRYNIIRSSDSDIVID